MAIANSPAVKSLRSQSRNGANSANVQDREDLVLELICSARRLLGYNPLDPDELNEWVSDWTRILSPIPTALLQESFDCAMREHNNGPFAAFEIVRAWEGLRQNRTFDVSYPAQEGVCKSCFGGGWAVSYRPTDGCSKPVSGVRPCECPAGRQRDKAYFANVR